MWNIRVILIIRVIGVKDLKSFLTFAALSQTAGDGARLVSMKKIL